MTIKTKKIVWMDNLRHLAEEKIKAPVRHHDVDQTVQLLYELRVHQIELEMQNEELRRTQQELEVSRACYFDLYNLAPVGYCTTDKNGVILEANLTAANQFGMTREALVNKPITRFILSDDQDMYYHLRKELVDVGTPQSCELRLKKSDSSTFWARVDANLDYGADNSHLCRIVISDISTRKHMEEEIRISEEKYRAVANYTHDWEFWIGPDNNFLYSSPSCMEIAGHSAAAFQNDSSLLRSLVHPDDLAAFDQHRLLAAKASPKPLEFEFRIIRAAETIRWIWISHVCQPIFSEDGFFLGTRGRNRDVTDRKNMEVEVVKARNLESLGILAGGIAHDFNNLLQGLLGSLSLAKMFIDKSSKAFPLLEAAEHVSDSATKLTKQLIAFSPGGVSSQLLSILPASYIREIAAATLKGFDIATEFDFVDDLWSINADPLQFHEVIKQMLLNAMEAMSSKSNGTVTISATNEFLQEADGQHPTLLPGNYVRISIQDQGNGISREHLPRIFDPYFSTKQRGSQKGMGLGLSLCDTIIRKCGGAITVDLTPGKDGTTFHIYIPAAVPTVESTKTMVSKDQQTQGPRILLMDDDPVVLTVTTNFLRNSGYRVDSALDGDAAVKAYLEEHAGGDPYGVIILDLTIPGGKGGKDVIAILKKTNPEVKAIITSGYANDPAMTDFLEYGFVAACAKPCLLSELKTIIDRSLQCNINPIKENEDHG